MHVPARRDHARRRPPGRKPDGRFRVPSTVAATVTGRVVDQRRMLPLLLAANTGKRADSRSSFADVATALVHHADWASGAITAAHAAIGAAAGAACGREPYSHDTVGRVIKALEEAGVLICPPGMGGRSSRALRSVHNQVPTYFVVDPDAPPATCDDTDLRTPPSHVSETVQVGGTQCLYERKNSQKSATTNETDVPVTVADRRAGARWIRARLLIGIVPDWRLVAMLAMHFAAGFSPSEIFRRVCHRPDGSMHPPLPVGDRRAGALTRSPGGDVTGMLLGMIGYRLSLWKGIPPRPRRAAAVRVAEVPAALPSRTAPGAAALAHLAALGLRAGSMR